MSEASRVTCPHCGEYARYKVKAVTDHEARYECGKCGKASTWDRLSQDLIGSRYEWRLRK